MTRFLLVLSLATLLGLSTSAQESTPVVRPSLQSLSLDEARLVQMSNDCEHFKSRLTILKEAYEARETSKVFAYHQLLLDAIREEVNQAMEAGEPQKNILDSLTSIMGSLEGHHFDVNNPQEARKTFDLLEKFLSVMQDAFLAETEKSSNRIKTPSSRQ